MCLSSPALTGAAHVHLILEMGAFMKMTKNEQTPEKRPFLVVLLMFKKPALMSVKGVQIC